jgi:hypothetical protein
MPYLEIQAPRGLCLDEGAGYYPQPHQKTPIMKYRRILPANARRVALLIEIINKS